MTNCHRLKMIARENLESKIGKKIVSDLNAKKILGELKGLDD